MKIDSQQFRKPYNLIFTARGNTRLITKNQSCHDKFRGLLRISLEAFSPRDNLKRMPKFEFLQVPSAQTLNIEPVAPA